MRTTELKENTYYHLSNQGPLGQNIFLDEEDRVRFLFLILYFQSPTPIYNSAWYTMRFLKTGSYPPIAKTKAVIKDRGVELIAFSINENQFDLLVKNLQASYASVYMHRVLTAYSKYYNAKHKRLGHVFRGPFVASTTAPSELKKLIAEIHNSNKNGHSSQKDYGQKNRWGDLLSIKK